jgi:hypothetical protein
MHDHPVCVPPIIFISAALCVGLHRLGLVSGTPGPPLGMFLGVGRQQPSSCQPTKPQAAQLSRHQEPWSSPPWAAMINHEQLTQAHKYILQTSIYSTNKIKSCLWNIFIM